MIKIFSMLMKYFRSSWSVSALEISLVSLPKAHAAGIFILTILAVLTNWILPVDLDMPARLRFCLCQIQPKYYKYWDGNALYVDSDE